jgi:EAL domain-containing protein (putative c-di-GMP-specific phosphodiesterase class I)
VEQVLARLLKLMQLESGPAQLSVSVNLSGASVGSEAFRRYLLGRLAEHPTLASWLCFEITETVAMGNLVAVAAFIEALHALGCRTALDDFGSGLCSFGYLKELPVTYLKIDGKLTQNVGQSQVDSGMIEAINQIGHLLGKRVVAECVEDEQTYLRLKQIGVDYVQGYFLDTPCPWDTVCARLKGVYAPKLS